MSDSFGLKLGIEGEKEFKQALKDINSTFKVLGSELTLVSSQFDKQDKSVEAITARNKVLNKEIEEQQKKIALLGDALENATKSFGESDKRTQNWQIQLNEAKATLNKLDKELEENNKVLFQEFLPTTIIQGICCCNGSIVKIILLKRKWKTMENSQSIWLKIHMNRL